MAKSMDQYLNEVDYSFKDYVPSKEALTIVNFIKEVNNGMEENTTPLVHLRMLDTILNKTPRDILVCHRGAAKSSLIEYIILYAAAFGKIPGFGKVSFIMYVSDSIVNGVKTLRKNIQFKYDNSPFLQKLIPNKSLRLGVENGGSVGEENWDDNAGGRKFTDIRLEFQNVAGDRLVVRGYGVGTGVRGTRELGQRPNVAFLDDIMSDEDARSETTIKNIEDIVYKAVSKALHPTNQKIVWVGTPFNAKDPLYKAIESGSWKVTAIPVCEKFPCTKEEFKGSWEDRFPYEYVLREYQEAEAMKRPENFNQELMLRVTSDEDKLLNDDDTKWFDEKEVFKNKFSYNFYITTDLATTVKDSSDYSVITVWAVNSQKQYMAVDGFCDKVEVSKFIKELFRLCQKYSPLSVGIEATGQQAGFISWIRDEMVKKNIYFNLASSNNGGREGIRPVGDKFSRFLLFVPNFKQGNVWVANRMKDMAWGKEFVDEASKASKMGFKSRHDDVLDTISMLQMMDIYAPSEAARSLDADEQLFYEDYDTLSKYGSNTIF